MVEPLSVTVATLAAQTSETRRRNNDLYIGGVVTSIAGSVYFLLAVLGDDDTVKDRDRRHRNLVIGSVLTGAGVAMMIAGGVQVQVAPSRIYVGYRWSSK